MRRRNGPVIGQYPSRGTVLVVRILAVLLVGGVLLLAASLFR